MLQGITIGQYYPTDSFLHKLDPRTKLMAVIVYVTSLFICNNAVSYLLATIALIVVVAISKVPISYMLRGLKVIVVLLIFSVSFHLFLTKGMVLVEWHIFGKTIHITLEGVRKAFFMCMRLVYLIIGSSLLTLTTTPNNLTDGMEKGLGFLKKIHFPVHELAMMMSIALRFIPILVEETEKIMKAQKARGADFETGGLIKRAKAMIPILVPLFVSAFRRANDLAMAMESRCYHGGDGRTKMKPLQYTKRDVIAYILMALYLAGTILLSIYATIDWMALYRTYIVH